MVASHFPSGMSFQVQRTKIIVSSATWQDLPDSKWLIAQNSHRNLVIPLLTTCIRLYHESKCMNSAYGMRFACFLQDRSKSMKSFIMDIFERYANESNIEAQLLGGGKKGSHQFCRGIPG